MSKNKTLSAAKSAKNDEFYTQYNDIQKEVNAYLEYNPDTFWGKTVLLPCDDPEWSKFTRFFAENFERLGLKKLISTSYAAASKKYKTPYQPSLFETASPQFDTAKTEVRGKIFVLDHDTNKNGRIDLDDLEWQYLDGDGDFRSDEVCRLRDKADVIVTNPPFSLFREFLGWIIGATKDVKDSKQFLIIGNMNAVSYTEVFPHIQRNTIWLGATGFATDMVFAVPKGTQVSAADKAKAERLGYVGDYTRLGNSCWFTNREHGRRHQPLQLMTMADNLHYSRHKGQSVGNLDYVTAWYKKTVDCVLATKNTLEAAFCSGTYNRLRAPHLPLGQRIFRESPCALCHRWVSCWAIFRR